MKRFLIFITILIGLTLASMMASGARTSWSIHRENGDMQGLSLPSFPELRENQRLLIVSPHPDDETLGCAGLIREAIEKKVPVTVAIVTNGDAFPLAVQRTFRKMRLRPSDYIRFGMLRQKETLAALRRLDVSSNHVVFLGYPDRGLAHLWMTNWRADSPYQSFTTRVSSVPYPDAFNLAASYSGQSLTDDLSRLFRQVDPTDIFFTHPNDDHPDHAYLCGFILSALNKLGWSQAEIATHDAQFSPVSASPKSVRLHTFLVHHGDWPVPQGMRINEKLPPPDSMSLLDTRWRSLDLSSEVVDAKKSALNEYRSQLNVPPGGRFLYSFIRRNELYGDIKFILTPDPHNLGPKRSTPWLFDPDPVNDKIMRELQPGADIKEIAVAREGSDLMIRLVTRGDLFRWATYRVNVHRLNALDANQPGILRFSAVNRKIYGAPFKGVSWKDDTLVAKAPLKAIGDPSQIMVNAETYVGGMMVDRSGWRGFALE